MSTPHPLLGPLGGLVGGWQGHGEGRLPDQPDFSWRERLDLATPGTPALAFRQRTTHADGSPFHAEDGWVRVPPELQDEAGTGAARVVELAVTSPTGILEALRGTLRRTADGLLLDVASTAVVGTDAAGAVTSTRRRWRWDGDELTIDFWMATPRYPTMFHHLTSHLRRTT